MVFVKVRETYDLHTVKNKMTVIGIHTPRPEILKRSYPGLLMQCKAYRPVSADVRIACASMLPLDPLGVGTSEGDVAPEDVFNPILYKAMSNKGMSQLEARINMIGAGSGADIDGDTATVDINTVTPMNDEFNIYYGLLSNTHDWKHASAQSGLSMTNLKPLVYDIVYNIGDQIDQSSDTLQAAGPALDGFKGSMSATAVLGSAKPMPFINCTSYTYQAAKEGEKSATGWCLPGFSPTSPVTNAELDVPWLRVFCGAVIIPPSRLHSLYFRMVVEWTIEFSTIRPISEIAEWTGLGNAGSTTHYQNYSYSQTKEALTGTADSILDSNDTCMVSTNADVKKVM